MYIQVLDYLLIYFIIKDILKVYKSFLFNIILFYIKYSFQRVYY